MRDCDIIKKAHDRPFSNKTGESMCAIKTPRWQLSPAGGGLFYFMLWQWRGRCIIRWFKHLADAADDEKLADLLTTNGPEGYGVWWLVVEVVAKQMDKTLRCEAAYPIGVWSKKCFISKRKTLEYLQVFAEKNLIFLKETEKNISVEIPKLLKFRDEYSQRSG